MTQEQIRRLHELEDEKHFLTVHSLVAKLPESVDINKMEYIELQRFIARYIDIVRDSDLLREISDKIMQHFYNHEDNRQKRLAEIDKEIEEL